MRGVVWTEADEPLQARKNTGKRVKSTLKLEEGEVPDSIENAWRVDEKKEESQGESARGWRRNLKLEVACRKKDCGTVPKRG